MPERRKIIGDVRNDVLGFLDKHGFKYMPSVSNKFMVDVKRPGGEIIEAMEKEKVYIGRVWPSMAESRARLGGHAGGDGQVQDRVPQGDGLTRYARRMSGARGDTAGRALVGDCSGGVIAALIALPYGLAMASLMGLPPVLGVFTSILTAPVIALLGRNPVLIGGTASATVPFIAMAVRSQGIGGAAKVSIVASVIMMAFCVIRLGRHIARVPHAVVTGFSCGIGAMMLISQLDIILGVDSAATRSAGSTLAQLGGGAGADRQHAGSAAGARRGGDGGGDARGALVAARSGAADRGRAGGVRGAISGLPRARDRRDVVEHAAVRGLRVESAGRVHGAAFGVRAGVRFERQHPDHVARGGAFPRTAQAIEATDADAELGAYGIANICAGMFGAPMSVGIPARSLAVVRCGGTYAGGESGARGGAGRDLMAGLRRGVAYSVARAGRGHGMDGALPARLERVAPASQDEPRGRRGVPGDGAFGVGGQRGAGGGDRLFAFTV